MVWSALCVRALAFAMMNDGNVALSIQCAIGAASLATPVLANWNKDTGKAFAFFSGVHDDQREDARSRIFFVILRCITWNLIPSMAPFFLLPDLVGSQKMSGDDLRQRGWQWMICGFYISLVFYSVAVHQLIPPAARSLGMRTLQYKPMNATVWPATAEEYPEWHLQAHAKIANSSLAELNEIRKEMSAFHGSHREAAEQVLELRARPSSKDEQAHSSSTLVEPLLL